MDDNSDDATEFLGDDTTGTLPRAPRVSRPPSPAEYPEREHKRKSPSATRLIDASEDKRSPNSLEPCDSHSHTHGFEITRIQRRLQHDAKASLDTVVEWRSPSAATPQATPHASAASALRRRSVSHIATATCIFATRSNAEAWAEQPDAQEFAFRQASQPDIICYTLLVDTRGQRAPQQPIGALPASAAAHTHVPVVADPLAHGAASAVPLPPPLPSRQEWPRYHQYQRTVVLTGKQ